MVAMYGDLGARKTAFVRGMAGHGSDLPGFQPHFHNCK